MGTLHAHPRRESPRLWSQPCHLGDDVIRRLERRHRVHARVSELKARVRRLAYAQGLALRAAHGIRERDGGLVGAPTAPRWLQRGHWSYRVLLALAWGWCLVAYVAMAVLLASMLLQGGR